MRNFVTLSVAILSCIAAGNAAYADVIVTGNGNGPVIISGRRGLEDTKDNRNSTARETGYATGNTVLGTGRDDILIYNGNSSANGGDTFVIQDGKFVRSREGFYDLPDGTKLDTDNTYNGDVGNVKIRN